MKINRTRNTITGTITGVVSKIITLVIPFIIRTIFIRTLGLEYLGLNSLFTSILQVLNLMELGVGSALVFGMYKPIADDDKTKICALMRLYRTYYRIIGLLVSVAGIVLIPFLPLLIKDNPPADINLYIVYGMNLANTVLSYWLFAYRNSLFQAHQRTDVINSINIVMSIICYLVQIAALVLFRNYYLYLTISILNQILTNIVTAVLSKKFYPQYIPKGQISKEEIRSINKKVLSLFTAKLGSTIHRSFDTIVISAFMGLEVLAIFQNYNYIITAVTGLVMVLYGSAQAGVGNYLIKSSQEAKKELLYKFQYLSMVIVAICSCCLVNLYQPFMKIWVGEECLLEYPVVILIIISFAADMIMRPLLMFKDSAGMWNEDKFRPLVAALTNLGLNLATVKWLGLYGVVASTIVSMLVVALPWLISNINKYQFKIDIRRFILKNILYILVALVCCVVSYYLSSLISISNRYLSFLVGLLISCIIPVVLFEILFFRTKENQYLLSILRRGKDRKNMGLKIANKLFSNKDQISQNADLYMDNFKKYSFTDTQCQTKEQFEASIIRLYHTIEKGLSYEDYRAGFGQDNIGKLLTSLEQYSSKGFDTSACFYETALSCLQKYILKNKEYGHEDPQLEECVNKLPGKANELGGTITLTAPVEPEKLTYEQLVTSRHSIRHFSDVPVDIEILKDAIRLAQFTPSACNRQGWKTRIVADKEKISNILKNQNGNRGFGQEIDKLLIITADLRAQQRSRELFQAFIDGGMYAESILNSLYSKGIGSVPLSASLTPEQEKNVRTLAGLDDAEVLIMFIGAGNYPEGEFLTTRSERKTIDIEVL